MESTAKAIENGAHDSGVTAIRHVLQDVAAERYVVAAGVVAGLAVALDQALDMYADAVATEDPRPESERRRAGTVS